MPWRAGGAGAVQPPQRRSQVKQRSRLARAVFQDGRSVGGLPGQGPPRREPDRNGNHLVRNEGVRQGGRCDLMRSRSLAAKEDGAQLTWTLPPSPSALCFPLHFLSPRVPFCSGSGSRRPVPWPGSWYLLLSRGSSSLQHFPLRAACWHRHCLRSNITCRDSAWVQFCEKLPPNLCSEPCKSEVFLSWFFVVVGFWFCFFCLRASVCSTLAHILGKKGGGTGRWVLTSHLALLGLS